MAPEITIDGDITGDGVLNIEERDDGFEITGTTTAEVGQEVRVGLAFAGDTDPIEVTGTVVAADDPDGPNEWRVTISPEQAAELPDGDLVGVVASVEDAAGNLVEELGAELFDTDFTAPEIGIDPVGEIGAAAARDGLEITGTTDAEDDQEVTVTFDGNAYTGTVTAGIWSVNVPDTAVQAVQDRADENEQAEVEISATVEDAAGNPADEPATETVTADFTGPSITINDIAEDNILNIAESEEDVTISGTTGNVGDGQEVTVAVGNETYTGTVNGGNWSATLPQADAAALEDGTEIEVTAEVSDEDDVAATPATKTLTPDFTAPTIAIDGDIAGDGLLNIAERDEDLTISGTTDAEDGQTVTLSVNSETYTAEAGQGEWSLDIPSADLDALPDGEEITVEADVEDAAGNPADATATFETDFTAPEITVADLGGVTDELTAADLLDTNGEPLTDPLTVSGTSSETGREVTVTIGALTDTAPVDGDGNWSVDFTPDDLLGEVSGDTALSIAASVEDDALNPGDATLDLGVDLSPAITIAEPADMTTLGLDAFEGGLDVSGTTEFVPDGQDVTVTIRDASDEDVGSITAQVTNGTWGGTFDAGDIAGLTDESTFSLEASVNNGFAAQDAEASQEISTDFAPEIALNELGDEGVLNLGDSDTVTVSGTTRGVQEGELVTVALLDEEGTSILPDDSTATVGADGTWSLDLSSDTVEALDAGETYDVQADVSSGGRAAETASQEVVAYLSAPFTIEETSRSDDELTFDVITDLNNVNGSGISNFSFTLNFDEAVVDLIPASTELVDEGLSSEQEVATGGLHPDIDLGDRVPNDAPDGVTTVFGATLAGSITDFSTDPIYTFDMAVLNDSMPVRLELNSDDSDLSVNSNLAGPSVSFIGTGLDDTIAAEDVDTVVRGRGGDDTIDLSGAGVNTVMFEAAPEDNGVDTVTEFSLGGSLPDRLGFAGLDNEALRGNGAAFERLGEGDSVGLDTGLIVFTTAMTDLEAASAETAVEGLDGPGDGDVFYFLASDGSDSALYEVEVAAGEATATEMAGFEGLGDLSGMGQDNILGFESNPVT